MGSTTRTILRAFATPVANALISESWAPRCRHRLEPAALAAAPRPVPVGRRSHDPSRQSLLLTSSLSRRYAPPVIDTASAGLVQPTSENDNLSIR